MKRSYMKSMALCVLLAILPVSCVVAGCGRSEVNYRLGSMEDRAEAASDAEPLPEGAAESVSASGDATGPEPDARSAVAQSEVARSEEEIPDTIWIHVCGAVRNPGVYELPSGSRVFEAVEAAGGLTEEAEPRSLNQASVLCDAEQITVYTIDEIMQAGGLSVVPTQGAQNAGTSGKVNLNTAGKEELMTLPGIGEARAGAILSYRETHGAFSSAEEIMNIDGIKEKAFAKIKDLVEV